MIPRHQPTLPEAQALLMLSEPWHHCYWSGRKFGLKEHGKNRLQMYQLGLQ